MPKHLAASWCAQGGAALVSFFSPSPVHTEAERPFHANLDGLGLPGGWLVIFDRRSGQPPIGKHTTAEPVTTPAGRTITLIRA